MRKNKIGGNQRYRWDLDFKIGAKHKTKIGFYHVTDFKSKAIFNKQPPYKKLDWDKIEENILNK